MPASPVSASKGRIGVVNGKVQAGRLGVDFPEGSKALRQENLRVVNASELLLHNAM